MAGAERPLPEERKPGAYKVRCAFSNYLFALGLKGDGLCLTLILVG
ncbi:hypothetical protein TREAZ_1031 [Leadbettera azotonutricia ZAS-9]|uniref:Uncharacterized protein n=1 Tax=Leadbettera azotonutricia (strain ATCC BAA-888 / DSM 13862 / ZAS-9) TaxID=545695 RepID=F5Y7P7_LEAAZ|nr:hypothetical protein TREAZ_1031 [Leadbettera azotonutricia ZAS-9]